MSCDLDSVPKTCPPQPSSLNISLIQPHPDLELSPSRSFLLANTFNNLTLQDQKSSSKPKCNKRVTFDIPFDVERDDEVLPSSVHVQRKVVKSSAKLNTRTDKSKRKPKLACSPKHRKRAQSKVALIRHTQKKVARDLSRNIYENGKDKEESLVTENGKDKEELLVPKAGVAHCLDQPELCSSLRLSSRLEKAKAETAPASQLVQKKLQEKEILQKIQQKVSSVINIPPEQEVYKDLIPLELSEEELRPKKSVVTCPTSLPKDPVPSVLDVYTPPKHQEFLAVSLDLPKRRPYKNYLSVSSNNKIYKLTRKWNSSDET